MEAKDFRDYAIGIGWLILVGGVIFIAIWLFFMTQLVVPQNPSVFAHCDSIRAGYILTISIDNTYGREKLENVRCEIAITGDLIADTKQQLLGNIAKGGRNDCYFLLTGDHEGPVTANVLFNNKSTSIGSICRQSESINIQ